MAKTKYQVIADFSGGYGTDLPNEIMPGNMLAQAENVYWEQGLIKRGGISAYSAAAPLDGTDNIVGACKAYLNSGWRNIIAVDDTSDVSFFYGETTWTEISGKTFTTGYEVEMLYGNGVVIAVNGVDKPIVIYYDSGYQINTLEAYDFRTRITSDWYAGQYTAAGPTYTDDTSDAQDAGADDFQLASTTNNDGFYVAGVLTFNKIVIKNCPAFDGSPVGSYQYYDENGSWQSLSMVTTPTWGAAEGDKTFEFNYPTDWGVWDGSDPSGVTGGMIGRYVIRVRFTTAPTSAQSADYLEIYHTQYLTQVTGGDIPNWVHYHNNRWWLANGNAVNYSRVNQNKNWQSYDVEYFNGGGDGITGLATLGDDLIVAKAESIHRLVGASYEDFVNEQVLQVGCLEGRSIASFPNMLLFLGNDDHIHIFNGTSEKRVSKHIATDIASFTTSTVCATEYKGNYWLSFYTDGKILVCDPDTYTEDETTGEGRMAFYKLTGAKICQFLWRKGETTDRFLACERSTADRLLQLDNGNSYDFSDTAIDVKVKTKRMHFGNPVLMKDYTRLKLEITNSDSWTVIAYSDNETNSNTATVSTSTNEAHVFKDVSLPYTVAGRDLSIYLRNNTAYDVKIYSMAVDYRPRRF